MTKRHGVLSRTIQRSYLSLPESWRAAMPRDMRGQVRDWLGLGKPARSRSRGPLAELEEGAAKGATGGEATRGGRAFAGEIDPLALEDRLWSGFAAGARADLEALAGLPGEARIPEDRKSVV